MIMKKLILSMMAAVLLANTPAARAVENSNSYYAYSTASVMEMSVVQVAGREYSLPLTMEQLSADGWEKSVLTKTKPGELYVIRCGEMQLSLSEDAEGRIEKIVDLYSSPGILVIPAGAGDRAGSSEENPESAGDNAAGSEENPENAGIKAGITEGELINRLGQLPLHWECAHFKNGTTRYKVLVPLGGPEKMAADEPAEQASASVTDRTALADGKTSNTSDTDDTAQETPLSYPACEYVITTGDRQVKAVGIRMISDPGPDGWSDEIIGFRVAAYYEKKAGELPPMFRIEEQKDGRVLIRLFEELEDHIATWALYRSDRTGKGYDVAFDPNEKKVIDFME